MGYYCNGIACNGQKIRRNARFYAHKLNRYHYCMKCFQSEFRTEEVQVGSTTVRKSDFNEEKNNKTPTEEWVYCEKCQKWIHYACALFNSIANSEKGKLLCPDCVLAVRKKNGKFI